MSIPKYTQTDYEILYDEWLSEVKARHPRLKTRPDELVWEFGQWKYPEESSKVQHPSDYAFEEEKSARFLDRESVANVLPEYLRVSFKQAVNQSIGGMLESARTGNAPYPLIDKNTGEPYKLDVLQKVLAIPASFFASVEDIALNIGGFGLGGLVSKGILSGTKALAKNRLTDAYIRSGIEGGKSIAQKQASRLVAEKFSDKNIQTLLKEGWRQSFTTKAGKKFTKEIISPTPFVKRWTSHSAPLAATLSGYHMAGQAASILTEKGRRGRDGKWIPAETKDFTKEDWASILKEGGIGIATGLTLGAVQHAMGIAAVGKSSRTKRLLKAGEIGSEAVIFGTMPHLLKGQYPKLSDEGNLIWTENGKPIQYLDEEGNIKNYSVLEGMKHSAFAIGSIKGVHGSLNGIKRFVGKKWRGRDKEIENLKKERDTYDKIKDETDIPELKIEVSNQSKKVQKKINNLEKDKLEGLDESIHENILKFVEAREKGKIPSKSVVEKAETEINLLREYIHKERGNIEGKPKEIPEDLKQLSKHINIIERDINSMREKGWLQSNKDKISIDKNKSEKQKKIDLEADLENYLLEHKEQNIKPTYTTIEQLIEQFGDIDGALRFFRRYNDNRNPQSKSQVEINKNLEKIQVELNKITGKASSKESIEAAKKELPSKSIEFIDGLKNITETDKDLIKSLLHKSKYTGKSNKENVTVIRGLTGEVTGFARWLNSLTNKDGKPRGLTLKDASQKLFQKYIQETKGGSLSKEAQQRYARQFKELGFKIDLGFVKESVKKDVITLTTEEYKLNIKKTQKRLSGEGDINLSSKRTIPKNLARVIMNLKSKWGHRDKIFKAGEKDKVLVGDVEKLQDGTPYGVWVNEKSGGGKEIVRVFRFFEPEIAKDIKLLIEGRNKKDLLFSVDGKKSLTEADLTNFSRQFISYGKEGVTSHKIRHFLLSAAKEIDKQKGTNKFAEWADRFLLLHTAADKKLSPSSKSYLLDASNVKNDFKIFLEFHSELRKMKDVNFNKTQTKSQRERIAEELSSLTGIKFEDTSKIKKGEKKEIIKGSGDANDRLLGKLVKKGFVEFNDRDPNYTLKDKLADASLVGAEIIAQGAKTLKDFTTEMVNRLGVGVRKYAKDLYEASVEVLNKRPEITGTKLREKLGIKAEQIEFKVPEIEANKILKKIKIRKYDDTEVERKIIDKQIERIAYKKGLTDARLKDEVYDALGFYDLNGKPSSKGIKNKSDLADAVIFIKENFPDFREPQTLTLKRLVQDSQAMKSKADNWSNGFFSLDNEKRAWGLGVSQFVKKYGGAPGKWLSKKLNDYAADYDHLIGYGDSIRESIKGLGLSNKQLNMMALMDRKVFSSKLTIEQTKFQKEMFNNPQSPQYKARELLNTMFNEYFDIILKRLKEKANPRDYEKVKKELTKQLVSEYFTRRITKEGSDYFNHENGRAFIHKAIRSQLYKDVVIKDKEYLSIHNKIKSLEKTLKDKALQEKELINKEIHNLKLKRERIHKKLIKNKAVSKLTEKFIEQFNHRPDKLIHPNLDFVRIDVPEFIPSGQHAGKRMYEMNWDATVGGYIRSSSKFAAAITHFPSLTSWHGKRFKTPLESKLLNLQLKKGKAFGEYVDGAIKNLVIGTESLEHQGARNAIRTITATTAVTGLSSFLSGVKNKFIGDVMNLASWGFGSFIKEYSAGIKYTAKGKRAWEDARRIGAFQSGTKHLNEIGLSKALFKYMNLMQPAENSNRASSFAMGFSWLGDAHRFLRGEKTLWNRRLGTKKRVLEKLNNTFELDKKDIDFFIKYGLDADLIPTDIPNYNKIISKHEMLMKHLARKTHVATQGATSVVDLPKWMNEGIAKEMTLFYRMAFQGNVNINRNVFKPLILRNPLPMFRLIVAGLGYGTLHWKVKHSLMGTERNEEHAKGATVGRLFETLSAVETFSLFGKAAQSLDVNNSRGFFHEWIPAIATFAWDGFQAAGKLFNIASGKYTKTGSKEGVHNTIDDWLKRTIVAYNHWSKIRDNISNPDRTRYQQARKIIRTFQKNEKTYIAGNYHFSQPLFQSLEREIMLADMSPKGMTTAAELYWTARTELREQILEEYKYEISHYEADKTARAKIDASIRNRLRVVPYSMNTVKGRTNRKHLFDSIDKEGAYILRKAEANGKDRLRHFWIQVNEINSDNRYKNW